MTFSGRVTSYLIAGAIAAALLFYGLGQISALLGAKDAAISAASIAQLRAHPALARYRAKELAAERRYVMASQDVRGLADSLRQALAAGRRVDTVTVLRAIAAADSSASRSCSIAYRSCAERAASAEAEADSLARQLQRQLGVHDRRCGLFGGGGAGKGTGAGLVLAVGCRLWP